LSGTDFPGYLGRTSEGYAWLHADWPAYAFDPGWSDAIIALGEFPPGTPFNMIDDIDQCFLFVVGNATDIEDKFDKKHFHVALWHEDVRELFNRRYVSGVTFSTPHAWAVHRTKELNAFLDERLKSVKVHVPRPSADDWTEEEAIPGLLRNDRMVVSSLGLSALGRLLLSRKDLLSPEILDRVRQLIFMRHHDTAIREACLLVESSLRRVTSSSAHGMKLVDEFFKRAAESNKFIPSRLKVFRTQVRAAFKFVRNDYAHNLHEISRDQCYAILVRISSVYDGIQRIASSLGQTDG